MDAGKIFKELCTPAKIYFIIAVISFVFAMINKVNMQTTLTNLLFAVVWTYILGWLCSKGYKSVSWFLVLLPYVLILLGVVFVIIKV
jgi:hypothetical protein